MDSSNPSKDPEILAPTQPYEDHTSQPPSHTETAIEESAPLSVGESQNQHRGSHIDDIRRAHTDRERSHTASPEASPAPSISAANARSSDTQEPTRFSIKGWDEDARIISSNSLALSHVATYLNDKGRDDLMDFLLNEIRMSGDAAATDQSSLPTGPDATARLSKFLDQKLAELKGVDGSGFQIEKLNAAQDGMLEAAVWLLKWKESDGSEVPEELEEVFQTHFPNGPGLTIDIKQAALTREWQKRRRAEDDSDILTYWQYVGSWSLCSLAFSSVVSAVGIETNVPIAVALTFAHSSFDYNRRKLYARESLKPPTLDVVGRLYKMREWSKEVYTDWKSRQSRSAAGSDMSREPSTGS